MQHANPHEREGRNYVRSSRRVASFGYTFSKTGVVDVADSLAGKRVIARIIIGNEHLQARVSEVLQPFIIRTIHVGLHRTEPCCAPTDIKHLHQCRVGRSEGGPPLERKARIYAVEVVKNEGLFLGLDAQLQVAEGLPIERCIRSLLISGRNDAVFHAENDFPFNGIAVAFLHCLPVIERLGIGKCHRGLLSFAEIQMNIGIGILSVVEKYDGTRVRRNGNGRLSQEECLRHPHTLGLPYGRQALQRAFHLRQRRGNKHPTCAIGSHEALGRAGHDGFCRLPTRGIIALQLPAFLGLGHVDDLAIRRNEVAQHGGFQCLAAFIFGHKPRRIGVHGSLFLGVALKNECRAQ